MNQPKKKMEIVKPMTKKHWWKYLLGVGALAIVGGVIAGGVVSCSNGNTTTQQQTQPTKTTPTTTSDYQLVPQATKGVIYNENLNHASRTTDTSMIAMSSSSTPNYLQTSSLEQQQGLDVYVGGELAAVINPTETSNPTLTLNLANSKLTAQELSKAGSLLAVEPTLTNYQITYNDVNGSKNQSLPANTPIQFAMMANTNENNALLQWGSGNSPLGAWFGVYCPDNQLNSGDYIYGVANFPVQADGQLNFTTVNETIPFSYVDNGKTVNETLNVNVDLTPFYLGTTTDITYPAFTSEIKDSNTPLYYAYMKAHDYSKPLVLQMPTPTLTQYKVDPTFIIWNGVHYPISKTLINFVDVPFTPTVKDGKVVGWTAGIYAYFVNATHNGVYEVNYSYNSSNLNGFIN